ncbi:ATP-binding protein [uncultured Sulfitobacter sp.]|uniref:ATP-binding protein n=1 Tax=uncultured Sulfitobacter sp. TaxID=191468 RepID=UPI0026088CA9|nr:ATP-binding protein [uncultured Sulfitobacter sp.]
MPELLPFAVSLKGTENAVRDGLAQAMACLAPLHLNTDDAGTVELVLAEALNNVVEHALASTPELTAIEIRGSHGADGLHITVIDCGAPMPDGTAPLAKTPNLDVETHDMPEGGFGWYLIHTLATDVKYSRVGAANHLSLQLPVGV